MAQSRASRQQQLRLPSSSASRTAASRAALPITLYVKGGLLMAFGPEGDPVPPGLVRDVCREAAVERLRMRNGMVVDCRRALSVLEAQQRGTLSQKPSNRWVEAMLGIAGSFEPTPDDLLEQERSGIMPPEPESAPRCR